MAQPPPPPPPPPPDASTPSDFHLPRTNFFPRIRSQLEPLERPPQFKSEMEPIMGFLIALISTALLGILFSIAINTALLPAFGQSAWLLLVFITPILEEISKAACMLAVAYTIVRMFPNRRYGAAVGAAAGLGFGVCENIIYIATGQAAGITAILRFLVTPIMHPVFSAFVGIGVFVFMAKKSSSKNFFEAFLGLPLMFLVLGIINHAVWNGVAIVLPAAGGVFAVSFVPTVIDIIIISPIFVFILRDYLGGHFNFKNFFEPLPEPSPYYPTIAPPPPPPQTTPTCPNCGQPLAFIQEYNRLYCSKCKRYV